MKQAGEASQELTSVKKTIAFISPDDVTVIGFFAGADDLTYSFYQDIGKLLQ